MPEPDTTNGEWREYRRLVMNAIEGLQADVKDLRADVAILRAELKERDSVRDRDIAVLKSKTALWGSVGGILASGLLAIIVFVIQRALR